MQKKPEERGEKGGGEKERNTAEIKKVEVITNKKDTGWSSVWLAHG